MRSEDQPHPDDPAGTADDPAFRRLLEKLSVDYNFDFREYKPASLIRRIRNRMQQVHAPTFEAYLGYLERHPDEHVPLFNTILINVTGFFRDPEAWQVLGDEIVPRLVAETGQRGLRVWSAGCSSGEEAYSAAMVIAEHLGDRARDFEVKIYATDVDEEALQAARQALYRLDAVKDVPAGLLDRYFIREGQAYRFRRDLRRWCIFGRHNLVQEPPLSHIDLLLCRNVLIYFTADLQERLLARFHYSVREGGFLFLGRSESLLTRSRWFVPYHVKWRLFQRTTVPAPTVAMAMRGLYEPHGSPALPADLALRPRLSGVIEALPMAIIVIDATDTILVWNPAAENLFDVPATAALGRKFRDLDVSYRVEGLRARVEQVKNSQIPARLEHLTFTRRTGGLVHAEIHVVGILEGDRAGSIVVYGWDATESARLREQMERLAEQHATAIEELQSTNEELETTNEELQSTNEELETTNEELQSTNEELETTVQELQAVNSQLATLNMELERSGAELKRLHAYHASVLSSLPVAMIVLDRDGVVRTWNPSAERLWGVRADDVVGRPLTSLPLAALAARLGEALPVVLERGQSQVLTDVPCALPGRRPLALHLAPLRTATGHIDGAVVAAPMPEAAAAG
ncbi:MAG TPA: CheR family methyltransferase [Candidatus Binatia bacterium]|nr:CheR family methyltransferase [Candidatus Binatia bacterium]